MRIMESIWSWISVHMTQDVLFNVFITFASIVFIIVYSRIFLRIGPERLSRIIRMLISPQSYYVRSERDSAFDIDRIREVREKRTKKLRTAIINGAKNNILNNLADVCSLMDGLSGSRHIDLTAKRARARYELQSLLLEVLAGEQADLQADDRSIVPKLQSFIAEQDHGDSYAELPDRERSVFQDLSGFIKSCDSENSNRKLGELASIIMTRDDDIARLQSANRTTLWLTVFGFISSIVFGLLAVFK